MITRIQKWGDSLGLRIPRGMAEDADLVEGSRVDVKVESGLLVIAPVKKNRYRLSDLLDQISPENLHAEVQADPAVGREVW
jgi:antitoxin MazE